MAASGGQDKAAGAADGGGAPLAAPRFFAHPLADVSDAATIGAGTRIWRNAHIREGARIGRDCIIGAGVYVGAGVTLGDRCKVQNGALLYEGLTLDDGVFVGPLVCFTNDYWPRAVTPDGALKAASDWELGRTHVRAGASIGAGAVVVTGIEIGQFAMVGAGSVVTRAVPAYALVYGNPARRQGWVCRCGRRLAAGAAAGDQQAACPVCGVSLASVLSGAAQPAP